MASGQSYEAGGCYCEHQRPTEAVAGCENSALLRHGSLLEVVLEVLLEVLLEVVLEVLLEVLVESYLKSA